MYCAYTIPGMTGSSLMYYYNGKAVRHIRHSYLHLSGGVGSQAAICGERGGFEGERKREREEVRR